MLDTLVGGIEKASGGREPVIQQIAVRRIAGLLFEFDGKMTPAEMDGRCESADIQLLRIMGGDVSQCFPYSAVGLVESRAVGSADHGNQNPVDLTGECSRIVGALHTFQYLRENIGKHLHTFCRTAAVKPGDMPVIIPGHRSVKMDVAKVPSVRQREIFVRPFTVEQDEAVRIQCIFPPLIKQTAGAALGI